MVDASAVMSWITVIDMSLLWIEMDVDGTCYLHLMRYIINTSIPARLGVQ